MMAKAPEAFRTIREVSEEIGVRTHVLRFWEGKFLSLKPIKSRNGRRYYRPEDITILRRIKKLLYEEGYSIRGANRVLALKGNKKAEDVKLSPDEYLHRELTKIVTELRQLHQALAS